MLAARSGYRAWVSRNTHRVEASVTEVWDVLADGWVYAGWVVGASRMRAVDADWPQVGSRLYHSFGTWPAVIDDHTEVLACEPGARLELRARGWPAGEAHVMLELRPADSGADAATEVTLEEDVTSGPGRLIPKPVRDLAMGVRNAEALRRLAFLAERRTQADSD